MGRARAATESAGTGGQPPGGPVKIPSVYVHCGIGLLTVLIAMPLVLRKVPPNRVVGIRVPKALVSEHNWYEINAYGGKLLLAYGALLFVFGYLTREIAPPPSSAWSPLFI